MTNESVLKYENYIYSILKKFDGYPNKDDLVQAGFLGLIMAFRNYKKDLNVKFTTYAYKYIYGEMCKLVRTDKGIKVSKSILKLKKSIEHAKNVLGQKLLRQPTISELAQFLEMKESDIEETLKLNTNLLSIDRTIDDTGDNLYDIIPTKQVDIDTLIALKNSLSNLDYKSKMILNDSLQMTEREVGEKFDMSQVKVSRTLKKIKQNIKQNMQ